MVNASSSLILCRSAFCGYRPVLIFAASSVCASANVRTIAAANAANALGVGAVTEGFAGPAAAVSLARLARRPSGCTTSGTRTPA